MQVKSSAMACPQCDTAAPVRSRVIYRAKFGAVLGAACGIVVAFMFWGTLIYLEVLPRETWGQSFLRLLLSYGSVCIVFMTLYGALLGLVPPRKKKPAAVSPASPANPPNHEEQPGSSGPSPGS
jgi:hypothetical protein